MNFNIAMNAGRNVVTSQWCRQFVGKIAGTAQLLWVGSSGIALGEVGGAEGQTRTVDTGIFSAVLYHLSYLGSSDYYQICAYVLSRR